MMVSFITSLYVGFNILSYESHFCLLTLNLCVLWILSRENPVYFYMQWVLRDIEWDSGYISSSSLLCPCSSASWTGAWLCLWMPFSTRCPQWSWRSCTHPGLHCWIISTGWVSSKPWAQMVDLWIKNYQNVVHLCICAFWKRPVEG